MRQRAEDHRFMMAGFAAAGTSVANLEYRLMPGVRLSDCVSDVQEGLVSLLDALPASRLLLVGHSAGAHLAVSALANARIAERALGGIARSGIYDLRPVQLSFLRSELHLTDAEVASHSLFPADDRPPVLYVNGRDATHEFLRASALMASKGRSAWQLLTGNHMTLTWQAVENASNLVRKLGGL